MPGTLTAAEAQRFARDVARRIGACDEDAARLAELLVRAEVGGHPGHGLRRLRQYTDAWRNGTIVPSAQAEIVRDEGSTLTLDGRRALGQVVCTLAADLAAGRALEHGVCAVAVRHSGHVGRLADFADRACGHGVAVLLFANDSGASQEVAPPGAAAARLSTNPLAAGIPRPQAPHLVVDLATSVAAHGKVQVLQDGGLQVPHAWMRDGLLQPLGGAKGFALGLLVEALAGVVSGAGAGLRNAGPGRSGRVPAGLRPRPLRPARRRRGAPGGDAGLRARGTTRAGRGAAAGTGRDAAALAARPGCTLRARAAAVRAARDAGRRARRRSGQELMKRLPGS